MTISGRILDRISRQLPDRREAALETMRLDLYEISPSLNLRINPRAKRMALRLDASSGKIHLVLPPRASLRKGLEFAQQYKEWIHRHAATPLAPTRLENGTSLPVMGQDRLIIITHDPLLKRTSIRLTDHEILVTTNKDDPTGRIIRFLKNLAREEITKLAHEKAHQIGRRIGTIRIGDTKTRWGSCSHEGNLSFSWRLVLAPPESFDYVIAHEVAHLVHMDHSKGFWALCAELSADFKSGHHWMKQNGHQLMRYC